MKLIQISDLHLLAPGGRLFGEDPLAHLQACVADINMRHADAELVVLSGDLTDSGEVAAYRALRECLDTLRVPWVAMLGNHDVRDTFATVFPASLAADGFAHAVRDTALARLIFLDSLDPGEVSGHLCTRRLAWLDARLREAMQRPVLLFVHHPPFRIGMPMIDACRLRDEEALHALCRWHGQVRHVFAGHVHRPVAGSWRGIPFSASKGTHHQAALRFTPDRFINRMEPPGYAVIVLDEQDLAVHFHDFTVEAAEYPG